MDALTSIPWGTVSPIGGLVLTLVYLMRIVSRGEWVPRRHHEETVATYKDALAIERAGSAELRQAVRILSEQGVTTDRVLTALPVPEVRDDA